MGLMRMGSRGSKPSGENAKDSKQVEHKWQEGMDAEDIRGHVSPYDDSHKLNWETVGFLRYTLFLLVFCAIVFGPRNSDAHYQKRTMEDLFVHNDFEPGSSFATISNAQNFWDFLNTTFIPNIFPTVDYTGEPLSRSRQLYLLDGANYRLGNPRLRFVRLKKGLCSLPAEIEDVAMDHGSINTDCFPTYYRAGLDGSGNEDQDPYYPGRVEDPSSEFKLEWKLTGQPQYRSPLTKLIYSGNGYVVDLAEQRGNRTLTTEDMYRIAQQTLIALRQNQAVDAATRAVFAEFNVYNPNVDIFTSVRLCVEFTATGAVGATSKVTSAPLLTNLRVLTNDGIYGTSVFLLFLEFGFFVVVGAGIVAEAKEFWEHWKNGEKYLRGWNVFDCTSLSLLFIVLCMRLHGLVMVSSIDYLEPRFYPEVQQQISYSRTIEEMNGLNAILLFFRLFKFTERNLHLGQLTRTIERCATDFLAFFLVAGAVTIGFGIAFHLAFGSVERGYMDFSFSLQTLLQCLLGDFDISTIFDANPYLALLLFASFIVVTFFVLLSMILAMVDGAYDEVRSEISQLIDSGYVDPLTRDVVYLSRRPAVYLERLAKQIELAFYRLERMTPLHHLHEGGASEETAQVSGATGGKTQDSSQLRKDMAAGPAEEVKEEDARTKREKEGQGSDPDAPDPHSLVDSQFQRYRKEYDQVIKVTRDLKSTQTDLEKALKTINARIGSASNFMQAELTVPESDDEEDEEGE